MTKTGAHRLEDFRDNESKGRTTKIRFSASGPEMGILATTPEILRFVKLVYWILL
jgi:hypothetical protein